MTCTKAQEFLGDAVTVKQTVLANKEKIDAARALTIARQSNRVVAMKGKKVVELLTAAATDEELLAVLMGPTGNLRAPTAVVGSTLLVGFSPDGYREVLGL